MKKTLLTICLIFLAAFTAEAQCISYSQAIKNGTAPYKTTTLTVNDSLVYELEYVRDQANYRDFPFHCYGHLELKEKDFSDACREYIKDYAVTTIAHMYIIGDGRDICNGETVSSNDIKGVLLYYVAQDGYLTLDHINFETGEKTSRKVHDATSSVSIYCIFGLQKPQDNALIIGLFNKDFNTEYRAIKKRNDLLYLEANRE